MPLKLEDIIDVQQFQMLQDRLNEIYSFPSAIIDNEGKVHTATAWQDVCTKFHRQHSECLKECIKSDQYIADHLHEANPTISYRCPHGLMDNATPIIIEGVHYGNYFTGQFFLESPDLNFFRAQAKRYGFDEEAYIEAVKKVPIWTQEQLNSYLFFIKGLIEVIASTGLKKLKEIEARTKLDESEERASTILNQMQDGFWVTNVQGGQIIDVNEAMCRMLGYSRDEMLKMSVAEVEANDSSEEIERTIQHVIQAGSTRFESRFRRKDGTFFDVDVSITYLPKRNLFFGIHRDTTEHKKAEQARIAGEIKFREIFDKSIDAIGVSLVGIHEFVNPAYAALFGYTSPDELVGKPLLDLIAPSERATIKDRVQQRSRGEYVPSAYETLGLRRDGSEFILDVHVSIYELFGVTYTLVIMRDITDRKRAEEALQESEANYRQLFDNSPSGIYRVDFRTGKFLKANDVICHYLGCSQEEITSLSLYDVLTDDSKKFFAERLRKIELGEKLTTNPEYEIIDKDGKHRWLQLNSKNIYDPEGMVIGADVVAHEITDRKRAEDAVRASEERFRELAELLPETVYETDIQGKLTFVNRNAFDRFGYTQEDFAGGLNALNMVTSDGRARAFENILRIMKGETIGSNEFTMQRKDGSTFLAMIHSTAIMLDGKPAGLRGFIVDITEHKRQEEERKILQERLQRAEKMEALGTLAGGVAHDLNNVLGIVVGYAGMLLDDMDENSPIRSDLQNILSGGERAAAIVQDLLTLARRGVSNRKVLNLSRMVDDYRNSPEFKTVSSYHPSVKINVDLEPNILNLSGSQVHISKTLFNLVSNGCESMPNGGVLTIRTANQYIDRPVQGYDEVREGDYVVLSVSDTGEGISADDLKRIFEPFYTKKIMGRSGTGLGLAVVWGTVKDHNGYINVQSEEGKGSTFTLYFPVTRDEITSDQMAIPVSEYMGRGESILIVDDVKGQRDLAAKMLGKLNYSIATVSSGEEAVAYLKEHEADILVLDMIMDPGMDGLDTYKSVLSIHPHQKAIIVSGFSETDRVKEAESLGAGAYVKKPYIPEILGLAVRKELDRK